jgi:hypothetical protein
VNFGLGNGVDLSGSHNNRYGVASSTKEIQQTFAFGPPIWQMIYLD